MFLAGIIKTHVAPDPEPVAADPVASEPAAETAAERRATLDATWPSFKPNLSPAYFGRITGGAHGTRARWT